MPPTVTVMQTGMVQQRYDLGIAYLLCFFLGQCGAHHFYLNNIGMGILYVFTFGLCGVGLCLDLCLMPSHVENANKRDGTSVVVMQQPAPQQIIVANYSQPPPPQYYAAPPQQQPGVYYAQPPMQGYPQGYAVQGQPVQYVQSPPQQPYNPQMQPYSPASPYGGPPQAPYGDQKL